MRHGNREILVRHQHRLRRLGDRPGNRLVVLEGIYSMLGDSAPLKDFVDAYASQCPMK